jgi:hypothetical protein
MADRIEREIEDILKKIDDLPAKGRKPRQVRRVNRGPVSNAQGWLGRSLARVSLNQVMAWALVVIIAAFFLRALPFATWLMIGALIVLATAFIFSLRGGGGGSRGPEKRWRGEVLDLRGPSLGDRIKAIFKGRR